MLFYMMNFSRKVFTYNAKSQDATVLDAITNKVIKDIPLKGVPEFSVTNTKGLIYVNIEDKINVKYYINLENLKINTLYYKHRNNNNFFISFSA